jgi:hypothetical protein
MVTALVIIMSVSCAFITIQDFRHRTVTWLFFPLLFLSNLGLGWLHEGFSSCFAAILINLLVTSAQFLLVSLYFFLRYKTFRIIGKMVGLGDVLFILAIIPAFQPGGFIVFLLLSMFISMIGFGFYILVKPDLDRNYRIPLAGTMSLFFLSVKWATLLLPINFDWPFMAMLFTF